MGRQCASSCGPTDPPATTTTTKKPTQPPTTTTTPCPTECCSDDDCEEGFFCENGECKKPCTNDADCGDVNAICNENYDNCQYCSADNICENGCAADSNCWAGMPSCTPAHSCQEIGYPALIKITVATFDNTNLTCSSGQLDNKEKVDYKNGMTAEFMAAEEDGLAGCEYANLNFHVTSGTAKWTGEGAWTKGGSGKAL